MASRLREAGARSQRGCTYVITIIGDKAIFHLNIEVCQVNIPELVDCHHGIAVGLPKVAVSGRGEPSGTRYELLLPGTAIVFRNSELASIEPAPQGEIADHRD